MDKIIKIFKAEIKSINPDKKRAVVVVSTDKKDGDGDIIVPESMKKNLKRYKDHPILLSSHNYYDLTKQIGMCHGITLNDKTVECDFEWFAEKGNPEADWAWFLAQKGIAAFSIGFQGNKFDWIEEKDDAGNNRITGRKFSEITLLEVSQVLVPSNAGALQQSINDEFTSVEQKEMCELVLKDAKSGKINFSDFSCKATKKDDTIDYNQCDTRITALEKLNEGLTNQVAELKQRVTVLESEEQTEVEADPDDPNNPGSKKKKHYSAELLGKEGIVPILVPDNDKVLSAIKDAFK